MLPGYPAQCTTAGCGSPSGGNNRLSCAFGRWRSRSVRCLGQRRCRPRSGNKSTGRGRHRTHQTGPCALVEVDHDAPLIGVPILTRLSHHCDKNMPPSVIAGFGRTSTERQRPTMFPERANRFFFPSRYPRPSTVSSSEADRRVFSAKATVHGIVMIAHHLDRFAGRGVNQRYGSFRGGIPRDCDLLAVGEKAIEWIASLATTHCVERLSCPRCHRR